MAADVVGFSRLMGRDEENTLLRLNLLLSELVQPQIRESRGRIVKLMGDGLLAEFTSVVDAAECAIAIQRAMQDREPDVPRVQCIQLRIGIHLGDVISEGSDVFGEGVNVAARLEAIAEPGGVCISEDVYRQIKGKVSGSFKDLGE
nr:adenylate/guanylate cyclase domain-containing protein [Ruegeria arenilitoris]